MHLATHLMLGWTVANIKYLERRDRGLVTLGGIIPDVDFVGLFIGLIFKDKDWALHWHTQYHHVLAHNFFFALLISMGTFLIARQHILTAILSFFSFHLHILGDLVGSRGPDGYQWPINYLFPFSDSYQLTWSGQWPLNAWPNIFITIILLFWTIYLAWKRGYSPIEFISASADRNFVEALRKRFGQPEYKRT
ncbi:MAG: metal-dependent hydrolase [Thermodesulfobacteriota bacterium]